MKKIIYAIVLSLLVFLPSQAQVDRSVQPKPGPAPQINLGKAQSFQLTNGLTVLVVENHKLPRVAFSLSIDNPLTSEGNLKGISELASNMMGNGTSKISKDDFNEKMDYYGASVNFGIDGVRASALSRYFPEVLSLAAQGVLDPLLTQDELDSEKTKMLDGLKTQEKSATFIAGRVGSALLYGKNHPKGEFEREETINNATLAGIKTYYAENFVPQYAYMVVVGDVKFEEAKKLITKEFSIWKKATAPKATNIEPVKLAQTEISFVDVPTAVQAEVYAMNITNLKMTDSDYYATLLANQILGGGADGRLFLNLREAHGWTYGAYSSIRGNKNVSNFEASTSVRNTVADSAVVEILKELDKIRTTNPTQDELKVIKAKYVGNFVMDAEKPQSIAHFALLEKTQSLPADFYQNYIKNINAVTLEQVKAAAQKHILHNGTHIIVVGKAAEILPRLEKLNIPIKYYDKNANPVAKPVAEAVSADVTPKKILTDYINAVGGEAAVKNIKTLAITAKGSIQGQELTLVQKSTADGKSSQEMMMMGMSMTKAVFDGAKGSVTMQGNKKDMTEAEVEEMKYSVPFPELLLLNSDVQLKGIEEGAYVLTLGNKSYFYDKTTHLKVAEATSKEVAPGQVVTPKITLSDYKEIQGVKIPYKSTMNVGVEIELNVTDVKINDGVSDADFQ